MVSADEVARQLGEVAILESARSVADHIDGPPKLALRMPDG